MPLARGCVAERSLAIPGTSCTETRDFLVARAGSPVRAGACPWSAGRYHLRPERVSVRPAGLRYLGRGAANRDTRGIGANRGHCQDVSATLANTGLHDRNQPALFAVRRRLALGRSRREVGLTGLLAGHLISLPVEVDGRPEAVGVAVGPDLFAHDEVG